MSLSDPSRSLMVALTNLTSSTRKSRKRGCEILSMLLQEHPRVVIRKASDTLLIILDSIQLEWGEKKHGVEDIKGFVSVLTQFIRVIVEFSAVVSKKCVSRLFDSAFYCLEHALFDKCISAFVSSPRCSSLVSCVLHTQTHKSNDGNFS